ncbi:hypothetical protein TIFTF001_048083 [Ficus carica]|uniref:Uncharacterized protein n=1 Tax=Ficus carica TaxID=3494 RepID=A0AA87ZE25_FICCA|nr:hypothetical protein TIFTF001_048079 [Ficus carica]GMN31275.1 hypothetical protein TIFTF001_048080 [Ficus carica]GMN31290.1 hypothetical protein TIFTF001_048082 [Ficus carica]GMN31309.1 hypothetical protein TIFTF001_048083 [Ficus carica]
MTVWSMYIKTEKTKPNFLSLPASPPPSTAPSPSPPSGKWSPGGASPPPFTIWPCLSLSRSFSKRPDHQKIGDDAGNSLLRPRRRHPHRRQVSGSQVEHHHLVSTLHSDTNLNTV